jgi:hypothetical protein
MGSPVPDLSMNRRSGSRLNAGGTIERMVTRDELRAWIEGYEIARMTPAEKLDQISRLMSSAELFDMSRRDADDQRVIEIWQRLRERWPANK